jgi:hypothetical protein
LWRKDAALQLALTRGMEMEAAVALVLLFAVAVALSVGSDLMDLTIGSDPRSDLNSGGGATRKKS